MSKQTALVRDKLRIQMVSVKIKVPALLVLLLLLPAIARGQTDEPVRTVRLHAGSSVYGSTGSKLPFWFHSNADGKVDPSGTNLLNELGFRSLLYGAGNFSLSAGANLASRFSRNNSHHFSELYAGARLGGFELRAGKFPQTIGLNNHRLSTGSMMVSRNAAPIPKIVLRTPEFLEVPLVGDWLEYKGLYSHGWFNEDRFVDGVTLHQKYLYLRINFGRYRAIGGLVHNAMWGGTHPEDGRFPQSFSDYLRVITGRSAAEGGPGGEVVNVLGNSVAAYDFALSGTFEQFDVTLTRMFYLEDKVSTRFRSPWDGVWGLNLYVKDNDLPVEAITYEHINTKNQDARSFEAPGRRDYYNHFLFENGWSYHGRAIGLPLILYDDAAGMFFNNILVAHHAGVKGMLTGQLGYTAFFTYSRNYGRNGETLPEDQFLLAPRRTDQYSLLLELSHDLERFEHISVGVAAAADFGRLYDERIGLMVNVKWERGFDLK